MAYLSETPSCPAVIVGASTAGLFAAYRLASEGVAVRLYEQAGALGSPSRTLIVTDRVSDVLGYVPSQAVVNRTHTVELFSPQRSLTVSLQEPDLIVERSRLVRLLAEKAAAAGAEIRLGRRFVGLQAGEGEITVRVEGAGGRVEAVRTRTLVGADGVASRVAREAGFAARRTMALLQAKVAMPAWARADVTQVWFDPQGTRYFYWLVPESSEQAVVGLIADDERQARRSLGAFLDAQGLLPLAYQAAQVPYDMRNPPPALRLGGARVLLVGDAGGQVKVTTVGGAVTGFAGAEAAVRAIVRGTSYGRELAGLRRELDLHLLVRRALDRFTGPEYDTMLDLVNRRTRGILATRNRDQIVRVLLPALVAQPRLLFLGLRALMRPEPPASPHPSFERESALPSPADR